MLAMDCPICKLTADEVENLSESDARRLISSLQQSQGWCFDHIFAFTDLAKRFPFAAKNWLREMVSGSEKIEA